MHFIPLLRYYLMLKYYKVFKHARTVKTLQRTHFLLFFPVGMCHKDSFLQTKAFSLCINISLSRRSSSTLPFRVLLGLQCFWDGHRPALRMDESARYIRHVLLAHSHRHHPVGASFTPGQSRGLHDVLQYVSGDYTLRGTWGKVSCVFFFFA